MKYSIKRKIKKYFAKKEMEFESTLLDSRLEKQVSDWSKNPVILIKYDTVDNKRQVIKKIGLEAIKALTAMIYYAEKENNNK